MLFCEHSNSSTSYSCKHCATKNVCCSKTRVSKKQYKKKSREYDIAVKKWNDKIESQICQNPSSKKFYNYYGKRMKSKSTIPPLVEEGKLFVSDKDKANVLNNYFKKVFIQDDGVPLNVQHKNVTRMEDFIISESDVQKAVDEMKNKIIRTPENIPPYFIKRTLAFIMPFLILLFNNSLLLGWIPIQWKKALVIPVFKKGNRNQPNNHRPISLTSTFSRIMECILQKKNYKSSVKQ